MRHISRFPDHTADVNGVCPSSSSRCAFTLPPCPTSKSRISLYPSRRPRSSSSCTEYAMPKSTVVALRGVNDAPLRTSSSAISLSPRTHARSNAVTSASWAFGSAPKRRNMPASTQSPLPTACINRTLIAFRHSARPMIATATSTAASPRTGPLTFRFFMSTLFDSCRQRNRIRRRRRPRFGRTARSADCYACRLQRRFQANRTQVDRLPAVGNRLDRQRGFPGICDLDRAELDRLELRVASGHGRGSL